MPSSRFSWTLTVALFAALALLAAALAPAGRSTQAGADQYLLFSGHGYVEVPDDPALNPTDAITIEAWVYLRSFSPACPSFVGKHYQQSYWLGTFCSTRQISFYTQGAGTFQTSDSEIPLDAWTHIAATYDGSEARFYMNGTADGVKTAITGPLTTSSAPLRIGSDVPWNFSPDGAIDEVRIWNVARSGAEIAGAMNTTITTPQAGLVAVFNFDGDTNSAVNGYAGTLNGAAELASGDVPSPTASPEPTESPEPTPTGTPGPTPTPTATPPGALLKGDNNCDGVVDSEDVRPYLEWFADLAGRPGPCQDGVSAAPQGYVFGQWFDASRSSGFIEIPHDDALNPAGEITIEALVNPYSYESVFSSTSCVSLVGNGYTTAYWLGLCGGSVRFYSRGSDSSFDSLGVLPLREWSHVAVTADATSAKIYIDGALDREVDFTDPLTQNDNPVQIGSDPNYNVRPWAAIDEVRIWNVARSQADIQAAMNAPIVPPQAGLVAAYQMEGNAGDATGNHDGAPNGQVSFGNNLPRIQGFDTNCDGYTNLLDALIFLAALSGADTFLPAGCETVGSEIG